jgi:hypothetical protein
MIKKVITLSFLILVIFFSCKETPKKEIENKAKTFTIDSKTTSIKWIAYKTTSKVPVKGEFTEVEIDSLKTGNTAIETLNNLKFKIPVNSLHTNDTIRDGKLKKFFFGTMENTTNILGEIHMQNENSGSVDITMNGITQTLPITYVVDGQMVTIEAVMDLDNWKTQAAITALNTVCAELHTGEDGISKTWSEVKIEVATYLK